MIYDETFFRNDTFLRTDLTEGAATTLAAVPPGSEQEGHNYIYYLITAVALIGGTAVMTRLRKCFLKLNKL